MTIVVLTRSTPDTAAKVEVDSSGSVTWGDAATVVNPWDEYALEEAILQAKAGAAKAVVVAIGTELHNEALKHSLAMGLDEAARVWDESIQDTHWPMRRLLPLPSGKLPRLIWSSSAKKASMSGQTSTISNWRANSAGRC